MATTNPVTGEPVKPSTQTKSSAATAATAPTTSKAVTKVTVEETTAPIEPPIDTDNPYNLKPHQGDEALYIEGNQIKNANGEVKGQAPKPKKKKEPATQTPMSMDKIGEHVDDDDEEEEE